jgi:hypothetical protein
VCYAFNSASATVEIPPFLPSTLSFLEVIFLTVLIAQDISKLMKDHPGISLSLSQVLIFKSKYTLKWSTFSQKLDEVMAKQAKQLIFSPGLNNL